MTGSHGNVIPLAGLAGRGSGKLPQAEILRTVVGQLDQLGARLQQFSPQSTWSAQRWMIASTPFRMRLTSGRNRLGDLANACATGGQGHDRWALELNEARREAERRLDDIVKTLHVLLRADTPPIERQRQTEVFVSARSDLLEVLMDVRHMVAQRLPPEPDPN
jgi:hypothetical protein